MSQRRELLEPVCRPRPPVLFLCAPFRPQQVGPLHPVSLKAVGTKEQVPGLGEQHMRSQSNTPTPGVLGGGELGSPAWGWGCWNHLGGSILLGGEASAELWRGCPAIPGL